MAGGLGSPKAEGRRKPKSEVAKSKEARASLRRLLRGRKVGSRRILFDELPVAVQRRCVQLQLLRLGIEPDFELVEQASGCGRAGRLR